MKSKACDAPSIGIVTSPIEEAGVFPLSNLIDVIEPQSDHLFLVTGNRGGVYFERTRKSNKILTYRINHKQGATLLTRLMKFVMTQLKISAILMKIGRRVDFFIFFIGGQNLLFPFLATKLLRKDVAMVLAGSSMESGKAQRDVFSKSLGLLSQVAYFLSARIIVYSESVIEEYGLKRYKNKVTIAPNHFLDFDEFCSRKRLCERDCLVGFIGRLSEEKGIVNLLEAVPRVLELNNEVRFLIGGNGPLYEEVRNFVDKKVFKDKIKVVGWIDHSELPRYLNELKLLVVPSYTEGLPNIMLEAMACGTPVLATTVGSIPDVIHDGQTGFLIRENSPELISENIVRAMNNPLLEDIAARSIGLVKARFSYQAALERYKKVISEMYGSSR